MQFPDLERRRRLLLRHHLVRTAADGVDAVRGVAAFHSTDPATPYLGMWARVPDFTIDHLDRLLSQDRSLWRMHAMRRTLFLVTKEDAPSFLGGASREVARKERERMESWLADQMPREEIDPLLQGLTARVLDALGDGGEWRTQELSAEIPELGRKLKVGSGKWAAEVPISSRLLFLLAMEGRVVRTRPAGTWRSSQYRWAAVSRWWDAPIAHEEESPARANVATLYLATHGPATMVDIRWWTGWKMRDVRAALDDAGAVEVTLDSGDKAFVLAHDLDPVVPPPSPAVAFLPGLDPTPMGWKERDWYLGPHAEALFDTNGNVGPTVWADGRVVGGWSQLSDGKVVYRLLEEVDAGTGQRIEAEAANLTGWLDGQVVSVRFRSPLEKELAQH